jgi:hypothetical protein
MQRGVAFRMKDNAFVSVADPGALQAAAERIDPRLIQERLDYWRFMLGPKFAQHERDGMDLRRYYFISQIEHAQNIIFKRNHPIHSIFERSCDLGLAGITTARIANTFGWRITKRTKGKHQVVLDQMDHGHHVLRADSKNAFVKQYEKDNTFLRTSKHSVRLRPVRLRSQSRRHAGNRAQPPPAPHRRLPLRSASKALFEAELEAPSPVPPNHQILQ